MKFDIKNILIGFIIGVFSTVLVIIAIGDIDIHTEFKFGDDLDADNKDINITIEKRIDNNGLDVIEVDAIGKGSVTIEDIESELGKVFTKNNIDALSGVEVNITLDAGFDNQ
ncbi:MAG: hypothetical protein CMG69_05415 [Candidatus Marinimicrobia bacterium]|nr:hypothetical protein [Candidatus Neomarinimicrobiota bacterium]|tara:strand:+ start:219 stop:554 length:336 start_codon:yes stop_codon:yes gene_type:complete